MRSVTFKILVLDLMMPGLPGLEVVKSVAAGSPTTKIVVLSMHTDEAYVCQSLKNGALGYVVKNTGAEELIAAIQNVAEGRRYQSPPLSTDALKRYGARLEVEVTDPYESLSTRERQVLYLAAEGQTNRQIATGLATSRRTVEAHRANLMHKLRMHSQAELIRYAIRRENAPTP